MKKVGQCTVTATAPPTSDFKVSLSYRSQAASRSSAARRGARPASQASKPATEPLAARQCGPTGRVRRDAVPR